MGRKLVIVCLSGLICLWGATSALAVEYNEAPMLKAKVAAGELPPVEERLPEDPVVIQPVERIGQYGGTWHRLSNDPNMNWINMILTEPPVRWKSDYTGYEPGVAESWEFSKDGRVCTFHFRKGLKWSDGVPFTVDDILFWWEDMVLNSDCPEGTPAWVYSGGELMEVVKVDDYTVQFRFKDAYWKFPDQLAQGFWSGESTLVPKHYYKQFHPDYNPEVEGYEKIMDIRSLGMQRNPDCPVLRAWKTVLYEAGKRLVCERNPYYWKVDPEGNQLPYIDRIEITMVKDYEMQLSKVIAGESDLQFRGFLLPDFPLLKANEKRGNYRVIEWPSVLGGWPGIWPNWTHKDPSMREIIQNRNFRIALSLAMDRERINDIVFKGLGVVQNFTISKEAFQFQGEIGQKVWREWANNFVEYDPDQANQFLDEMGMTKGSDGWRRKPNGEPFNLLVLTPLPPYPLHVDVMELVEEDWEKVGIKTIINAVDVALYQTRRAAGDFDVLVHWVSELDIWGYPQSVFPVAPASIYLAPAYCLWYQTGGKEGEEPPVGDPFRRLLKIYDLAMTSPTKLERDYLFWAAIRIHIDEGPFVIAPAGQHPDLIVVKNYVHNVPDLGIITPWAPGGPSNVNPCQFYIEAEYQD